MKRFRPAVLLVFLSAAACGLGAPINASLPTEAQLRVKLDRLIAVIDAEPFMKSLADTDRLSTMSEDGSTMWQGGTMHLAPGDHPLANTAPWGVSYAVMVSSGTDEKTAVATLDRWRELLKKSLPVTFAELPRVKFRDGGHYRTIFYRPGENPLFVALCQDASGGSPFPKEYNEPGTWRVTLEFKCGGDWENQIVDYYDEHPNLKPDDTISRMATSKATLAALLEARNAGFTSYRGMDFGKDDAGHPRFVAKAVFPGRPAPLQTITVQEQGIVVYQALFAGPMMTAMIAACYEDALTPAMKAAGYGLTKTDAGMKTTYSITWKGEVVSKYAVDKGNSATLVIVGLKE